MTKKDNSPTDTPRLPAQLCRLGWDDTLARKRAAMETQEGCIARVISAQRGLFLVTDGINEWACSPAGRLLHATARDFPITGDWVLTSDTIITAVIPRRNILSRGQAGSRYRAKGAQREQAIAANLDTVFIVCGLDRDFNVRRLERYLTLIHNCGLSPIMVLTKADLHHDPDSFRIEAESIAFGVPVILTSMGDNRGKSELECHLKEGKTVAMVGSSGAGKSTLANMLYGSHRQATGHVSNSIGKGRHITTTRDLIPMPQGGMLMDNPGIREIAFYDHGDGMQNAFADIRQLAEQCRFADCSHRNEPGCAVLCALETGELTQDRLGSYLKMQRELDYVSTRRTKSADRIEKERWKDVSMRIKSMKKGK